MLSNLPSAFFLCVGIIVGIIFFWIILFIIGAIRNIHRDEDKIIEMRLKAIKEESERNKNERR